jgi:crotonobetainyl-CoA:carnitine CoA-transferase CaiB-like acyl-CoA transferase
MFTTGMPEPLLIHIGVLDQATAIAASHAIITALFVRERRKIGQEIHVSLYSTALWLQHPNLMLAAGISVDPCVPPVRDQHSPLRNRFCCKDGKWIIGTHHPEEKYWSTFCEAVGQESLLSNSNFTDEIGRPVPGNELINIFDKVFLEKTRDEWMEIFQKKGLMFSPVLHISEVENDFQARVNDYVVPFDHPIMGKINIPGYPIHFSENSAGTHRPAPGIGEHTDEILNGMGYSAEDIEQMKKEKIIQ